MGINEFLIMWDIVDSIITEALDISIKEYVEKVEELKEEDIYSIVELVFNDKHEEARKLWHSLQDS